jgi:hypothetical protein
MAADDVANALMAMDDDRVRAAVAGGDLSAFDHLDLDDDERTLVQSAAEEADVEGFSFQCNFMPAALLCNENRGTGFNAAVNYAKQGASANLAPSFNQWTAVKNAQGGW